MAHFQDNGAAVTLEPMQGSTYSMPGRVAAYAYDVWPPSSVLAGRERRSFLESFDSLEDARAHYPTADVDPRLTDTPAPDDDVDDGAHIVEQMERRDDAPPCPYE